MVQCFMSDERRDRYARRIEKVKFGVPASEAFSHGIPATLLVLLLRVNKLGPVKKDVWRAPGNQAHVRKLIDIMQHGRLVNIENFSVYTAASVIKKFLSKLTGGIFGAVNEELLFGVLDLDDCQKRCEAVCRVLSSLSVPCQHLLVLLFGTFRLITDSSDNSGTRMSPEAIGLSVAPSLFHTCIHNGQRARLEDVIRFRTASRVVTFVVEKFGFSNLFPRENYEFYARITGRTLRVDTSWHFSFHYPSILPGDQAKTPDNDDQEEQEHRGAGGQRDGVRKEFDGPRFQFGPTCNAVSLDELKELNRSAARKSSSFNLEWVHERQTLRMQTRSEWFLTPLLSSNDPVDTCDLYTRLLDCSASGNGSSRRNSKNRHDTLTRRRSGGRGRYGRPSSASALSLAPCVGSSE